MIRRPTYRIERHPRVADIRKDLQRVDEKRMNVSEVARKYDLNASSVQRYYAKGWPEFKRQLHYTATSTELDEFRAMGREAWTQALTTLDLLRERIKKASEKSSDPKTLIEMHGELRQLYHTVGVALGVATDVQEGAPAANGVQVTQLIVQPQLAEGTAVIDLRRPPKRVTPAIEEMVKIKPPA